MKKPIIELKNVWKVYKMGEVEVTALHNLNLNVYEGEFISIMGPSGSGKSTAMNMIGCLDVPTTGTIKLEDQNISELHESDLAQIRGRMIGFIFQKFNLIGTMTAKENVMLPLTFQGMSSEEREKRAIEVLRMVELEDRMNHKPNEMSGGEQQRVAIARALAVNPDIILADEPTGNLDSKSGDNVMSFLKKLHEQKKKTIIMVTHDEHLAKNAEKMYYLKDGAIIKSTQIRKG